MMRGARGALRSGDTMGLDLVSTWMLAFFGACAAGGLAGLLLGKLLGFELGLGAGLLVPGIVSLAFTARFVTEYRTFRDDPSRTAGVVVAIEDRAANASGSVTTPVAIVEFTARDGATRRTASEGGTGLHVGDAVTVVPAPGDPTRAKVGQPRQLFGGAVASLLFGTFPASAGLFFVAGWIADLRARAATRAERERAARPTRLFSFASTLMLAGMVGAGLWDGPVHEQIEIAFAAVSVGLWIFVVEGTWRKRDPRWTLGTGLLAINFSVWVLALWLLTRDQPAAW
jgi:hypothetical protein